MSEEDTNELCFRSFFCISLSVFKKTFINHFKSEFVREFVHSSRFCGYFFRFGKFSVNIFLHHISLFFKASFVFYPHL